MTEVIAFKPSLEVNISKILSDRVAQLLLRTLFVDIFTESKVGDISSI